MYYNIQLWEPFSEQPGIVEGISAYGKVLEQDHIWGHFQPKLFYDPMIHLC